ncbi:MAG: SpoIIE family protein phosphatase [bacterium]|nr:SpoIIE family protein phosphatase [bacterium]
MAPLLGFFTLLVLLGVMLWISHLRQQIQQLRLLSRQAQKEQEAVLSLIDKLGERITSKIDLDETLKIITEYIVEATKAESGAIFVINEADQTLQGRVVIGPFPPLHETHDYVLTKTKYIAEKIKKDKIRVGEGIIGLVAQQGESLLVTDAEADPRVPRHASLLNKIHSIILCPLRVRGTVLGVFVVVNKLGDAIFDSRDMALLQALSDQAAVTVDLVKLYDVLAEQQRLEQELAIAHEFQRMLLPREFPRLPAYDLYAMSEAATVVGGDFFDFFEVDDRHMGLVIADVAGKGIPGALIMAMVRAVLRAEARGCLSPKDVLRRVNERIVVDTKENVFITMTYGILNLESGRLRFVRAGHEPLLIVDAGARQVRQVEPEGIALGLVSGELFNHNVETEVQLNPGEVVLLYTDGVIEAMDQSSAEYGRERLIARLEASEVDSAENIIRQLVEDIHQFTLGIPQHDDITILALRILTPGDEARGAVTTRQTA